MTDLKNNNDNSEDIIKLDYSEYDPEILAICSFFSFFLLPQNIKFHKQLVNDEAFTWFFGDTKDGAVSFDGIQSKEYYKLCEFFTRKNLWATKEDIRIKNSSKMPFKLISSIMNNKKKHKKTGKTFILVYTKIENHYYGNSAVKKVDSISLLSKVFKNTKEILLQRSDLSPQEVEQDEKCRASMLNAIGFESLTIEQLSALSLAYGIVAEYGVDRIRLMKPWQAGKQAFLFYKKATKRTFKKIMLGIVWSIFKPILILAAVFTLLKIFI